MDQNIYWWRPKDRSFTYDEAKEHAEKLNGRLLKLAEVEELLKIHAGVLFKGKDVWIPCTEDEDKKQWAQLGDKHHRPGRTHEEWGWPGWGDEKDSAGTLEWRKVFIFKHNGEMEEKAPALRETDFIEEIKDFLLLNKSEEKLGDEVVQAEGTHIKNYE